MSYDVWIDVPGKPACSHCNRPATEGAAVGDWNFTSNCSAMWDRAGAPLRDFAGRPADKCALLVRAAITRIEADRATYEAMDPPNGWGSVADLLPALAKLADLFEAYPDGVVRVSL